MKASSAEIKQLNDIIGNTHFYLPAYWSLTKFRREGKAIITAKQGAAATAATFLYISESPATSALRAPEKRLHSCG